MTMEYCASYLNISPGNDKDSQFNHSNVFFRLPNERVHYTTSTVFSITTTTYQNNHNTGGYNDYNHAETGLQGNGLDLISNWKAELNEEENGMAISVYVVIHVVIGLIGVVLNGL